MTTPQSLSDAAHADPARHIAAKLMRLAEAWIDGTGRRWDRLEQMDGLVRSLRQTYAQELERREPVEPQGVGMSDRYALPASVSAAPTYQCWGCGQTVRVDVAHQCLGKPATTELPSIALTTGLTVRTNGFGCRVVDRFDLARLPLGVVRVDCLTCGGWYAEGADAKDMPCKGKPLGLGAAP